MMVNLGYVRKEVEESLSQKKYNDIMATYLLLGRKNSDVSSSMSKVNIPVVLVVTAERLMNIV